MTGKISKIDRLRQRDGELCWLCSGKLIFDAVPNSKQAPTIEHLISKSNGGTGALENLVLTHPGCNQQLGNRPSADKIKMRERRLKKVGQKVISPTVACPTEGDPPIRAKSEVSKPTDFTTVQNEDHWRRRAFIMTGATLFFAGLSLGLLLS